MEAKVTWCGGMRFVGLADSGHALVMDSDATSGGGSAPQPKELLLLGLAGCTGMDVVSILRKKRQPVAGLEIVVRGEQAADHPRRLTTVAVEYVVRGAGLDPEAVRRAIALSEERYCSVGASLRQPVSISSTFRVLPPE